MFSLTPCTTRNFDALADTKVAYTTSPFASVHPPTFVPRTLVIYDTAYDMTGFLDLPAEIRLIVYGYLLPDQDDWFSHAMRGGLNFYNWKGESPNHAKICKVAQVNRTMRHEALSLTFSKIEFHLTLFGQNLQYAVAWLRQSCLLFPDAMRSLDIHYAEGPKCSHLNFVFNTISKLPNVSLQLSLPLETLALADSPPRMAFKHVHGFTEASFGGFITREMVDCDEHCPRAQKTTEQWANLERRFKNAVATITSPCPGRCRVHPGRSRDKSTSKIEITWCCTPHCGSYCMACICAKFFETWEKGPKSILNFEAPGDGGMGTGQH